MNRNFSILYIITVYDKLLKNRCASGRRPHNTREKASRHVTLVVFAHEVFLSTRIRRWHHSYGASAELAT